ncbi:hypothetical protein Nepgr_002747 [Nepenthes gracilis]|uniref:Uncharacterized protein n=1 Tax=Nepenthes gracilis TaxID=150966 RepID=A0AAD3P970_NEPGR|nr:hypothetical protein Nepgr_002747 [Nepenthes gracilis]
MANSVAAVLGWQWRLGCCSLCISIPTSLASHKLLSLCSARYDVAAFCSDSHISAESTDQKSEESRKQRGPDIKVFDHKEKLPVKSALKATLYMGERWYYDFQHNLSDAFSPPNFYARRSHCTIRHDQRATDEGMSSKQFDLSSVPSLSSISSVDNGYGRNYRL